MRSETLGELGKAMALAQAAIKGAAKDSENPHLKSRYADLASVWEACRDPLTSNGLSVIQATRMEGAVVVIITTLLHSSGEYISGEISLPPIKQDPQGHGSAMTYARRYALAAMVGVAPAGEDDDGHGAGNNKDKKRDDPPLPPPASGQIEAFVGSIMKGFATGQAGDGSAIYTSQAAKFATVLKSRPDLWANMFIARIRAQASYPLVEAALAEQADAMRVLDAANSELRDRIGLAIAEQRHQITQANPFGDTP